MPKTRPFLPLVGLYHAANDGAIVVIPAILPILIGFRSFGLDYAIIGLITSIGMAVTTVGQIFVGRASDERDSQKMMAGGISILILGLILLTRAYDVWSLLFAFVIVRLGASFYHPICISWVSKKFSGNELDSGMGYQSAWGDGGVMVALVTTGYIALATYWWVPVLVWAGINIVAVAVGTFIRYDTRVPKLAATSETKEQNVSVFRRLGRIWFVIIPFMVCGAVYIGTVTFGPLLITDKLHQNASTAGLVIALWIGAGVVAAYLYGRLAASIGRKNVLVGAFITSAAMCILIAFTTNLILMMVLMLILGLALFMVFPGTFSIVSDLTGKVAQGELFGWLFALHVLGGAMVAYLCGITAEAYGISSVFLVLTCLLLGTMVCFLWHDDGKTRPRHKAVVLK